MCVCIYVELAASEAINEFETKAQGMRICSTLNLHCFYVNPNTTAPPPPPHLPTHTPTGCWLSQLFSSSKTHLN